MADRLGKPLMPWQQLVADVGGELDPDTGLPAYREVIVTVPRQSGKTMLILSWQLQRAIGQWGGPQRIAYSAQTGNDARKKLIEDQFPLLRPRKKALRITRLLSGMGNEAVEFMNGSRIVLLASSEDSGHGKTIDLGVKDELFADVDNRRDQALIPAMSTRASAQVLTSSTMGTARSAPLNRAVERGRAAVDAGARTGIAYFEWSADPTDDPADPETWWRCMPALGHTVTEATIAHARDTLPEVEFLRAFLNVPDLGRARSLVFDADCWADCLDPDAVIAHQAYAIDVTPDGHSACIAASDGRGAEVVDHRPGTAWVVPRLAELGAGEAVLDPTGPAGALIQDLNEARIDVQKVSLQEHAQACGGLLIAVNEGTFVHKGQPSLDAAVVGAARRKVNDVWLWTRGRSDSDICPLVAVTLARWAAAVKSKPVFAH